jgi:hypothetical protein
MTDEERAAVVRGRYTRAMRLANIERYCRYLREAVPPGRHVALADGLPANDARRFLLAQFPPGEIRLVLVTADPGLWEERLRARSTNVVDVGYEGALQYVREHWEPLDPDLPHAVVENGPDPALLESRLCAIYTSALAG